MNNRDTILFSTCLLLGGASARAQFDIQLPLQYGMQQMISNPALLQDHKVSIGLFSVGGGFLTPVSLGDAGEVRDGTLYLDPDQFINRLKPRGNDQRFGLNAETLAFNYRHKGWQVGASHAVRGAGSLDVPKGLAQLAAYGNGRYVGQELQLAPRFTMHAYQEFGINAAVSVVENLTIGARIKYLAGSAALTTTNADVRLYTDPDYYQVSLTTNMTIASAGVPLSFDSTGARLGSIAGLAGAGNGFGIDLGLAYRHGENLQFGVSIRDLGTLVWKRDAMLHTSRGSFTYSAYEGNVFNGDDRANDFDVARTVDSLVAIVDFESSAGQFRTDLPTTIQATARYKVAANTSVDGTVYAAKAGVWHSGFGIGLAQRLGKYGQVGSLAGIRTGGAFVGANLLVDLWGPQFYVACDNLLTVFKLDDANDAYVRAGINLTFGQIKPGRNVLGWYDHKVEGINK